jgi:hypothetical protein
VRVVPESDTDNGMRANIFFLLHPSISFPQQYFIPALLDSTSILFLRWDRERNTSLCFSLSFLSVDPLSIPWETAFLLQVFCVHLLLSIPSTSFHSISSFIFSDPYLQRWFSRFPLDFRFETCHEYTNVHS